MSDKQYITLLYSEMKCPPHDWIENHSHPMFHATRVCADCGKIEIKAARIVWGDNYANITKEEAQETYQPAKFQV